MDQSVLPPDHDDALVWLGSWELIVPRPRGTSSPGRASHWRPDALKPSDSSQVSIARFSRSHRTPSRRWQHLTSRCVAHFADNRSLQEGQCLQFRQSFYERNEDENSSFFILCTYFDVCHLVARRLWGWRRRRGIRRGRWGCRISNRAFCRWNNCGNGHARHAGDEPSIRSTAGLPEPAAASVFAAAGDSATDRYGSAEAAGTRSTNCPTTGTRCRQGGKPGSQAGSQYRATKRAAKDAVCLERRHSCSIIANLDLPVAEPAVRSGRESGGIVLVPSRLHERHMPYVTSTDTLVS